MCFRKKLDVNISCVCSQENSTRYLEVRHNENVTPLLPVVRVVNAHSPTTVTTPSLLTVTSVSSYCLVFISLPSCHNKKMYFSHFSCTKHTLAFQKIQEARLESLSAIKVIIRENEETTFLQKEKF